MANEPTERTKVEQFRDGWIDWLADQMRAFEAMQPHERFASLCYLKSRYASDWPSDGFEADRERGEMHDGKTTFEYRN